MKIRVGTTILRTALLVVFAMAVAGCAVESSEVNSGLFVDAPVEGLMYESGNLIGRTDAEGRFFYEGTEDITFSIEGVVVGTISPKAFVTPFDLFTTNLFVSDPEVTNISRFIQSLDREDKNPDNGITISETTRADFYNNFSSLSALEFSGAGFQTISSFFTEGLRTSVAAQTHLLSSLADYNRLKVDLINLGDGFTAGVQSTEVPFKNSSTSINLHKYTQANGYPSIMAGRLGSLLGSNFTWSNPLLNIDENRNKSLSVDTFHYNLGIPGATAKTLITETTGSANVMLDELLTPVFSNLSASSLSCSSSGTQVDAAKCLASQEGHEQRLKIFTLWIGMNDVLGAITAGGGSELTSASINAFLSDNIDGHDLTSVMSNLSTAVAELGAVKDSYIFIANLPDLTKIGALYYRDDIESLAQFANVSATAMEYFDNVTGTEIVALGSYAFAHYSDSAGFGVSRYLDSGSSNALLNNAISGLGDSLTMTKLEADLIKARVDEINLYIQTFADPYVYPNVFVVDVHGLYEDLNARAVEVGTSTLEGRYGGGFFSLDGIYPSNTGYALIAKEFIGRIGSPFTLSTSDAAFSTYSTYLSQKGINPDNGIGINLDPETVDLASIWSGDPYRDKDGDGFPAGPGAVALYDYTSIPVADPTLGLMYDCGDSSVDLLPESVSGIACNGL